MTDDVKLPHPDFSAFNGPHYYTEATVRRLIAEAKAEEREMCASIAENYDLGTIEGHGIAQCIRGV